MKIDGTNLAHDLIQQMQDVAQKQTENTSAPFETPGVAVPTQATPKAVSDLEQKIQETAKLALAGKISDATVVRERVIDAVLDQKLGNIGSAKERRSLRATVRAGLVDDPAFIREVDQMLLLAAREVSLGS